jgi:hypothetical protein
VAYYIDAENINLDDLRRRIGTTDLVPSRLPLLEEIDIKMEALRQHGITTLARLRHDLKTSKRLEATAEATGIDRQYLVLLRREIESYFPKAFALKDFEWLPKEEIARLEEYGIRNSAALYEATSDAESRAELIESTGVDAGVLDQLIRLVDLTRVQWVSPTAARMLVAASCDSAASLAAAGAEELCEALDQINKREKYFKGKIGLRDVKRLIKAAAYVL